jgi:uncharacterized protein YyaL (SSP411 family)
MPNRLATETSPYLQQHAENPVDWWPWSAEALAEARATDKPILLSIGYAACHWCHVMAHESFEDVQTAAVMNALYVCIKVDREERPDLDGIYMQAVQAMTGQGGWPMTVFLTPDGEPFYGGTYFPPEDRHGMPSFVRVLESVHQAWRTKRADILRSSASVKEMYDAVAAPPVAGDALDAAMLGTAFRDIARRFEPLAGGFGGAPKFPQAMTLDFVLRHWARTGDAIAERIVRHSFQQMSRGGIFDQIGGGFHRYTVDALWVVPHFEKMLYDNALLARLGVHLYQAFGEHEVALTTRATLDWVLTEMTDASGGWYSSLDADSEGEEGKFYVWTPAAFDAVLGADAEFARTAYGVTAGGNFEGQNIPTAKHAEGGILGDDPHLAAVRRSLLAARSSRIPPFRDEKILASWNGFMLRAMAEGARVFDEPRYRAAALRNGEFLWSQMVRDGRAFRTHMRGESRINGYLEDHTALGLGFIALYQLTGDRTWLERALVMDASCVRWFWDDAAGAFYDTAHDAPPLVTRPRDISDNATPAGTSLAAELQLTCAEFTGDAARRTRVAHVLATLREPMARYGTMFGHALGVADMLVHGAVEVAIAGAVGTPAHDAMLRAVAGHYVPSLVLATGDATGIPLLEGRTAAVDGATGYVCHHYACGLPAESPAVLAEQLARVARG